jgi:aminoglycoside 2''-phosphotransferase
MADGILRPNRSRRPVSTPRGLAHYRDQIVRRHPELVGERMALVAGGGQYNVVVVVGERLVFRFPRFPEGVARLPALAHLLRAVCRHVALATPDPLAVVVEPPEVGHAYVAYAHVPGEPLTRDRVDAVAGVSARRELAAQLAAFLAALHAVPAAEALPGGPLAVAAFDRRAEWTDLYARIRARLFPAMRRDARRDVAAHFEAFLGDPRAAAIRPALVHGDFGPGNVLATEGAGGAPRLSGVIDFDRAGLGDPAVDLAAAESFGLAALWDAYPGRAALRERARFYRGTFALQEALYGVEHGDEAAFTRSIAPYR